MCLFLYFHLISSNSLLFTVISSELFLVSYSVLQLASALLMLHMYKQLPTLFSELENLIQLSLNNVLQFQANLQWILGLTKAGLFLYFKLSHIVQNTFLTISWQCDVFSTHFLSNYSVQFTAILHWITCLSYNILLYYFCYTYQTYQYSTNTFLHSSPKFRSNIHSSPKDVLQFNDTFQWKIKVSETVVMYSLLYFKDFLHCTKPFLYYLYPDIENSYPLVL